MGKPGHVVVSAAMILCSLTAGGAAFSEGATKDQFLDSLRSRQYSQAVDIGRRLFDDAKRQSGSDSLQAAEALELIAWAMAKGQLGSKAERLEVAEHALTIKRGLFGDSGPEVADGEYWVGLVHYFSGDTNLAVRNYETALRLAREYYGDHHSELERYTREYGASLYVLERYLEAKSAFEELYTLSLDKYGPGTPGMVKALFNLALVHKVLSDLDQAERFYAEAIEIIEAQEPRNEGELAQALDSYANLLSWQGRLEEALATNTRVLEFRRKADGPASASVAGTLTNRARILEFVGDYQEAQAYLEESLAILSGQAAAPGLVTSTRVNLAVVLRLQGRHREARKMFASAKETMPQGYPTHRWHREYATLLAETGDTTGARKQLQLALRSLADTVGAAHVDYGNALVAIGALDYRDGRFDAARKTIESALEILEDQIGRQHPVYAAALDELAVVYRGLDEKDLALDAGVQAESLSLAITRATLSVLPERIALAQSARGHKGRDVAISVALTPKATTGASARAFDAVVRSRAVVFDEIISRNRFYAEHGDANLTEGLERLRLARTRLASLFMRGSHENPVQYERALGLARREIERLEESLARKSREFRLSTETRSFGLDELAGSLPEGAVLLSFAQYDRYGPSNASPVPSYLAALVAYGKPSAYIVDLGPASVIDRAIQDWRDELNPGSLPNGESIYRSVGTTLRKLIWDRVAGRVGDASLVLIVPDGPINLVSFASLPVGESAYLVEQGLAFHYLTAERDLARTEAASSPKGRLLLVGAPAFFSAKALSGASPEARLTTFRGSSPVCRGFETEIFSSLPGTAREVHAIEGIWKRSVPGTEVSKLSGRRATESAVKAAAPDSRVLHFATHGFYLGGDCTAATQIRGVGGLSPATSPRPNVINPLLLSGVVLAGANRRSDHGAESQDDGILTAEEISALQLTGVHLAVLSACRSGSGSVAEGEGVFGLRRAFLVAGATSVVSNLWDVADNSAQNWIARFYEQRFAESASVPEAVRVATIEVLEARRAAKESTHPFFWGGWLAAGGVN